MLDAVFSSPEALMGRVPPAGRAVNPRPPGGDFPMALPPRTCQRTPAGGAEPLISGRVPLQTTRLFAFADRLPGLPAAFL
jgi:hypothetical protein